MADLTHLFTVKPSGPGEPMRYRQGLILQWNPATLENTVLVGDAELVDLPVIGVAEVTSYRPGVVVALVVVGSTWGILGRFVLPGTQDATDAITQLSARTGSQTINTQETRSLNSFGDLATVGPSVTVDIGPSGRALLLLSAKAGWSIVGADVFMGGFMSAEVSGANTYAASLLWAAWIETQHGDTDFATVSATISATYTFEALLPGPTTFTAKYMSGDSGVTADFSRRTITVIAL